MDTLDGAGQLGTDVLEGVSSLCMSVHLQGKQAVATRAGIPVGHCRKGTEQSGTRVRWT